MNGVTWLSSRPLRWMGLVLVGVWFGCGGGKLPETQDQASKEDPHAGMMGATSQLGSDAPTDDNTLPLKLKGLNSLDELNRGLSRLEDQEIKEAFERGYRKTFTADAAKRDYSGAAEDLETVIQKKTDFAPAYRARGYARFNLGFNIDGAMEDYTKAVELAPDYGEAHYALAFMYAMGDLEQGAVHYKKAIELGIPDERGLGDRFYTGK